MKRLTFCRGLTMLFLFCTPYLAFAASKDDERTVKLIEGAKKEGSLLFYSALDVTNVREIAEAFQKQYPFIKVDFVRAGSEGLMTRILAEANAKKLKADVIQSAAPHMYAYKKKNMVKQYMSPEAVELPESAKDPAGYWASFYENIYVMAYNTRLVSPKEVPRSFDDLLKPRWKGKMAMDSKDARWYGTLEQIWGKNKNLDFMNKLAKQDLILRSGKTLLVQLLGAGEFEIAISAYLDAVEENKGKGASINWAYLDPVIISGHPIWIPVTTPHPNAATLFVDFLLSDKGGDLMASLGKFPPKATANTNKNLAKYYPGLGKKVLPSKKYDIAPEVAERYEEYSKQFRSIFMK